MQVIFPGGGGGGAVDLQTAYDLSSAPILVLASSPGPFTIRDAATPLSEAFRVETNAAALLFRVTASAVEFGQNLDLNGNQITEATEIRGAGDITIRPNGDTDDGLVIRTATNEQALLPEDDSRGLYFGGSAGLAAAIAVNCLDSRGCLELLPLGNAGSPLTSAPANPGIIAWNGIYETNFVNNNFGGVLNVNGTYRNQQNGFPFNHGLIFNHAITYENLSGAAANFGPIFTLVDQPLVRSTGGARTISQHNSVRAQPKYGPHTGGGTLTLSNEWLFYCGGQIGAGTTVTQWTCFYVGPPTNAGTLTAWTGIDFPAHSIGTTRIGIRSALASPATFISHTGTAAARFGGEVEINGALNHDGSTLGFYGAAPVAQSAAYTASNVTTDRTYDANATTLNELADVLGTLIRDLQGMGLIG